MGSVLAIYFGFQKITNKVIARYTASMNLFSSEYISNVVLINKRDKVVSICSLNAVFEKNYSLELNTFDPPLILKPYESISISLPKFTSLSIANDAYHPDYIGGKLDLYIDTGVKIIKCQKQYTSNDLNVFTKVSKHTSSFNGHVYNKSVKYFISYFYDRKNYTAFVTESGIIDNEWNFSPNNFGQKNITPQKIDHFLKYHHFDKLFSNYVIFKVNYPNYHEVLRKGSKLES